MNIFVTGASGWIGSATVQELLGAGHQVLGLARSERAANALTAAGARAHRGSLEELESLRRGVELTDGVIHTAFIHDRSRIDPKHEGLIHDYSRFVANSESDRRAIVEMGAAMAGSRKPLVVVAGLPPLPTGGRPLTEEDIPDYNALRLPRVSEKTAMDLADQGVRASVVRLPPSVHGEGDTGFVPDLIRIARVRRTSGFVGDGKNRWPAVHRSDAARVLRLALENGTGGMRYHAVGDEGIPFKDIAAAIGGQLGVPVVSVDPNQTTRHFASLGAFVGFDLRASSAATQERLGWRPTHLGLLADLAAPYYFKE